MSIDQPPVITEASSIENKTTESLTLKKTLVPTKKEVMKAEFTLSLHSWQARGLFFGKWEHGKFGLIQYAKTVYFLTKAAEKDDPYAEWFLIKTDDRVYEVQQTLAAIEAELQKELAKLRGFEISIYSAEKPLTRFIEFLSPLGFMGAKLLVDLDHIIRTALTLKKMGIYLSDKQYNPRNIHQALLTLFELPSQWFYTGITRQDIYNHTPIAEEVKAKMGELPTSVLEQKIQLPYLKSLNTLPF